ncbi:helix-turn-helix domain-containing protein [Leucobacter chromiireducens]|uniref:XRE family transcriptional regulator n=1 Tax=Leucobacter chromiireducens subsp. chromiireducens TaxID=660067 RepID=A0ABS1SMM3_9MICO|nr:XRE family transcriptional regulator [Leucobacter chromiireducens subsp. chromiireducens]
MTQESTPLRIVFGARVREHRLALELTQEALAERLGVSVQYLGRVERGENLTFDSADRFAAMLGLDALDLLLRP